MSDNQDLDLAIRHYVFHHFALETRPPSVAETAKAFDLTDEQVKAVYERLHQNHFFFLEPGTTNIRMANPFAAIPTQFSVKVGQKTYWANCAWDMLGIPAALQKDATITAQYEDNLERVVLEVKNGQLHHDGGRVHFALPARQWYDDLILT